MFGKLFKKFTEFKKTEIKDLVESNYDQDAYLYELDKFEQIYLQILKNILYSSANEDERNFSNEAYFIGKFSQLITIHENYSEALSQFANYPFELSKNIQLFLKKKYNPKKFEKIGKLHVELEYTITKAHRTGFQLNNNAFLLSGYLDKMKRKALKEKKEITKWYSNAYNIVEAIKNIVDGLRTATINIQKKDNTILLTDDLKKSNRPYLLNFDKNSLSKYSIYKEYKVLKLFKKYGNQNYTYDQNKLAKGLFPNESFTFHNNHANGIVSPYQILTKLICDLVVVFDYYIQQSDIGPIEEMLNDAFSYSGGSLPYAIIKKYNDMGFPLLQKLHGRNNIHFSYGEIRREFIYNFIKMSYPFVLGNGNMDFTKKWFHFERNRNNLGFSSLRQYF